MGALAEEMEMVREEGREEGSERKLSELVEFYVEYVAKKMSETGKTAEVIMSDLPILPECYDRVLETLARKG